MQLSSDRAYRSEARAEAAAATRRRIVGAATQQFLTHGFHATAIATVAKRADVSPQTIYNSVGGKAALLKASYDVLLVGDDEPIPMNQRPEIRSVLEQRSRAATLRAYAHVGRVIYERVGALLGVVVGEGAGGDAELAEFLATIDRERRVGSSGVVEHLVRQFGLPVGVRADRFVDHLWALTAPEVCDRLTRRCGWSLEDYERWLAAGMMAGLKSLAPA
jgi:AcrR family transcriptional regulator